MIVLFLIGILAVSLFSFSLSAGFILLNAQIKPYDTSEKLKEEESAMPGMPTELTAHVRDPKIMTSLLAAKNRWYENPIEKLEQKSFDFKPIYADFWEYSKNPKATAILVHGHMDSARGMAYLAEEYHKRGFSVLSIDMRGHGRSKLKSSFGYKDAKDILLWIAFLQKKYKNDHKIIVHGVSMGSSSVLRLLSLKKAPANIALAIIDSSFASFKTQLKTQIDSLLPNKFFQTFVKKLLLFGLSCSNFLIQGFFFYQHAPIQYLKKRNKNRSKSIPILFFHGLNDSMVPVKNCEILFALTNEPKKQILIDDALHIGAYFYAPEIYMQEIENLFH